MNKRLFSLLFFTSIIFTATLFGNTVNKIEYLQKGDEKYWCPISGLSIEENYKTSLSSTLSNGRVRQYASLACLAKDNEEYGIDLNNIKAIDYNSLKRINAKKAFFVVGSSIKAKISKTSKLAFENEKEAKDFIKQKGGKLVGFEEAFSLAKESLKDDFKKLKTVNKKKIYPKGEKIFEKRCDKNIDPTEYLEINELKADITKNKLCKNLNESQLQTVALYLWGVKRFGDSKNTKNKVVVEEDEKCPVCGMFVAKYPRWAAQIIYSHEEHEHKFSFDGVKDLMKFYFDPKRWINIDSHLIDKSNIKEVKVTDYYSQEAINGKQAYYVIGSDVYGPMGHELIPFKNLSDAKTFKADHSGKKIVEFKKLEEKDIYKLDE